MTPMARQPKRGVESANREVRVRDRDRAQRFLHRWRYGYIGLAGATVFFCLSVTPSLRPERWARTLDQGQSCARATRPARTGLSLT